ncbi:uncharacterized protein LOC9654974 [Selaginella moellendorffii]|nr:uncharacterized protein LOC9654974 [Selaginella moellendorffii]|eukprot:XP_002964659.2 uncharacterized protein LOC9654974 [Selaginella moellendorffii]
MGSIRASFVCCLARSMAEAVVAAAAQPTKLSYFDNMRQLQATAKVLSITKDSERVAIVSDRTILYPQGGGQPADRGSISSLNGDTTFQVQDTRMKNGVVYHYGVFEPSDSTFEAGQEVTLRVESQRRELHSRLHTAGHLIDVCMKLVGRTLEPAKGNHSPEGAFVEYIGAIPSGEIESTRVALQKEIDRLIASGASVNASVLSYDEAAGLCGGSLPDYISKDSSPRIVRIGDHTGCPCGGTHVDDVSSLTGLKVTQIRVKKGVTKVSYTLK